MSKAPTGVGETSISKQAVKTRQDTIDVIEHMCYSSIVREAMDLEQANTELDPEKSKIFLGTPQLDLPPEYCRYRDEGCDLASSCLNCPFPKCVYDQPRGRQRWLKRWRDREIVRLFNTEGKRVKELALMFGLSQRTVQRALKNTVVSSQKPVGGA